MSVQVTYMQRDNTVLSPRAGAGESGLSMSQPPAPKFSPGQVAAILYSLFKHVVAQSVQLINKPEISFPPVGSAVTRLSQSTLQRQVWKTLPFFISIYQPPSSRAGKRALWLWPQVAEAMLGLTALQPERFNGRITCL